MPLIRILVKSFFFIAALIVYAIISISYVIFSGFSFKRARPHLVKLISDTSKFGLKIFNVKVRKNFVPIDENDNYLIISNHLTYLDILIISSFFPTCFVTSNEMKETPFLGQMCMLGGCLFVERRNKKGLSSEVGEIAEALSSGLNVVVFPEATSTNGEAVIRFRRPLFQAAIDAHTKVLPVCLNYRTLDSEKLTLKNRDKIFWYGDMGFLGHALKLFMHKQIVAELSVMNTIDTNEYNEKAALAEKTYQVVSDEYEVVTHAT